MMPDDFCVQFASHFDVRHVRQAVSPASTQEVVLENRQKKKKTKRFPPSQSFFAAKDPGFFFRLRLEGPWLARAAFYSPA
jgi:hypothetical protein